MVVADLNHDGRPDVIALASGMPELVWYENPTWERHVIAGNRRDDQLRGGRRRFRRHTRNRAGQRVLQSAEEKQGGGFRVAAQWRPAEALDRTEIDRIPASHRLRSADIDGSGKSVVINAALARPTPRLPSIAGDTPLVFYRPGEWKREVIAPQNEGVVHGIYIVDWDGDGRDEILTAGFEGIHLFKLGKDGKWTRTEIAKGDPSPWPKSGSSDVAVGKLGKERYLAAIEPWHGEQVAVYRRSGAAWQRVVIDSSLVDGHTIQTADLNGDGNDEVIAGYRGQGHSVYIYSAEDADGTKWSKRVLDQGGMGAAACAVADLNGDGRPDIACIGTAGANLKWYENLGR